MGGEKEETRIRATLQESSTVIPQVTSNPKDHKAIPDTGIPKARGVTGASRSINQRLSDLTNDNLTAMLKSDQSNEVNSTEMALFNIESLNKMIRDGEIDSHNMIIGSLDVSNLYGSINVKKATQLVRERALQTKCKWEGIDLHWTLIYLALTLKPWE